MTVDTNGNTIPPSPLASNYRLFIDGQVTSLDNKTEKLKRPFLIAKKTNIVDKFLGKHPVIYVDFSHISYNRFSELIDTITIRISDTFKTHDYMLKVFRKTLDDGNATAFDKKMAQKRCDSFNQILQCKQAANTDELRDSLKFLAEILHNHFKTSVFILIDEYDAPTNVALMSKYFEAAVVEKIFNFYTSLLVTTLKNAYLEKAILTGRFPLTLDDIHSGLDNIAEYTFLNGKLMEFYGFKLKEINIISKILNITANVTHLANTAFGGYEFRQKGLFIYNSHFIVNYLATNKMTTETWLDTSSMKDFLKFFMTSGVVQFDRYWNAFQPASDGYTSGGGHSVPVKHLAGGHFTRSELSLMFKATKYEFDVQFNQTLYKFHHSVLADKTFLFLYTMGYFTMMDFDERTVHMEYPLKDRNKVEEFCKVLEEPEKAK